MVILGDLLCDPVPFAAPLVDSEYSYTNSQVTDLVIDLDNVQMGNCGFTVELVFTPDDDLSDIYTIAQPTFNPVSTSNNLIVSIDTIPTITFSTPVLAAGSGDYQMDIVFRQ